MAHLQQRPEGFGLNSLSDVGHDLLQLVGKHHENHRCFSSDEKVRKGRFESLNVKKSQSEKLEKTHS